MCLEKTLGVLIFMSQAAVGVGPLVISSQRGLRNRTSQAIFMAQKCTGHPVLIYCCSFSLYYIYFMMIFDDPFVLMLHIVYLISFLFIKIFLFILCVYFYMIILKMILFI